MAPEIGKQALAIVTLRAMSVFDDTEMAAWSGFLRAHKVVISKLDAELQHAHDLPLVWYDALVQLHMSGRPLRMKELAGRLLLSRSATTRFVDRLESAGLVSRSLADDDRRGMTVELTEEGYRRLREASPTHLDGVKAHFVSRLGRDELETLASAWKTVLTNEG